ncbi:MAG: alpha-glucan family phosphorylase [Candidatus Levyibacteriota bacterium]
MKNTTWFRKLYQGIPYNVLRKHPIAYFCAEYAFTDTLRVFAGGLGVLAGDFIQEAADQKIPFIAIGIYYSQGYSWKKVASDGKIKESIRTISAKEASLKPVVSENGKRIYITVPIQDRVITIQAWQLQVGSVPVYFLDTNTPENSTSDQQITAQLYVADSETRLLQEIVLGIGGRRLIEYLGITPAIYHMNEGHAALLALDLLYNEMKKNGLTFAAAKAVVKKQVIFTNHTLVVAGTDLFTDEQITSQLGTYAATESDIAIQEIISLGKDTVTNKFSMTELAFSLAGKVSAVSKLHAKSAQNIWKQHPMIPITNGIYIKRWDTITRSAPLWECHQINKRNLLLEIQKQTGQVWKEDELLIGWARRMVAYKRPLAIFEDMKRFLQISKKAGKPVHIVFAGEAHANDKVGLSLIQSLREKISNELAGTVVYLSDYNLHLARLLTSGCDIWLNTPIVGLEACGTSGMKAALNGVLPATTKDGWFNEINIPENGWLIDTNSVARSLLDTLETRIIPLYYESSTNDTMRTWERTMVQARSLIIDDFSTTRMLREYLQKLYIPLINEGSL